MHRIGSLLLATAAATFVACGGGGSGTSTSMPDNSGGTAAPTGPAFTQWGKLLVVGASWTFDDTIEEMPDREVTVVEAKVAEVRDVAGGKAIIIDWTVGGEPMEVTNMPEVVVVTDANVTLYGDKGDFESSNAEGALVFPAAAEPAKLPGGLFIEKANLMPGFEDDKELCYGWGPEEGDEDCEDVCFAQICVDPEVGLTGGDGMWWPGYVPFAPRASE
jgi:hypothetical protein